MIARVSAWTKLSSWRASGSAFRLSFMGWSRAVAVSALGAAAVLVPSCTVFNGLSADLSADPANPLSTNGGLDGGVAPGPSHTDGQKNDGETDVDCGGSGDAPRCADLKTCVAATDCTSGVCPSGTCAVPTATDGVKNGDESDVDCGGASTGAPKCDTGRACALPTDCASDGCDYTKKCALGRSCTQQMGGVTCGSGEVGDPKAVHESCCTTIAISTGVKLDKYKATSGRVRAMVDRLKGDVKGWYTTNKATLTPAAIAQIDPWVEMLPAGLTGPYGIAEQLGSNIYIVDKPSAVQGCQVITTGTHTFWLSDTDNMSFGDGPQGYSKDVLDTKPVNCITMPMAAAFCAWDGGRLQTFAENKEMYGTGTYPWGATPVPGGFGSTGLVVGPATAGFGDPVTGPPLCPTCNTDYMNWHNNYQFPDISKTQPKDFSYFISAPGRFQTDKGPLGHLDAGGDMLEWTGTDVGFVDDKGRSPTFKWGKQGSWEGHPPGNEGYSFTPMTKYAKASLRCAHD